MSGDVLRVAIPHIEMEGCSICSKSKLEFKGTAPVAQDNIIRIYYRGKSDPGSKRDIRREIKRRNQGVG